MQSSMNQYRLPSHEGSGLKLFMPEYYNEFNGLPSHEGSGLKSIKLAWKHAILWVSPRMRGVD